MSEATGYAGDVSPAEAWERLKENPRAALVDVRTHAEWVFVGLPDLSGIGRQTATVSWQFYPSMAKNPSFLAELKAAGIQPDQPLYFLCRSGVRSKAAAIFLTEQGFGACYNISEGFEGNLDPAKHRGIGGWKATGLPWAQQ